MVVLPHHQWIAERYDSGIVVVYPVNDLKPHVIDGTYGEVMADCAKTQAESWFNLDNPDFVATCHNAGFEPEYVIEKINKMKKEQVNEVQR